MGKKGPQASTLLAQRALPETCSHLQPWPLGFAVLGYQLLPWARVGLSAWKEQRASCWGLFPKRQRDPL